MLYVRGILFFALFLLSSCSFDQAAEVNSSSAAGVDLKIFTLLNYTNTTAKVNVTGSLHKSGTTELNEVHLHLKSDCSDTALVKGLQKDFSTAGLNFNIPISGNEKSFTKIYLTSNTFQTCLFLGDFEFNPDVPSNPVFYKTDPVSPTRLTYNPLIFGLALENSNIFFYSDSLCVSQVGTGSANDFLISGISIQLSANTVNSIYTKVVDSRNRSSACSLLTEFQHSTVGPVAPLFARTFPVSPNNISSQPLIYGTVTIDSESVSLYSDSACSQFLVSDSALNFKNNGINITVVENTNMTIYAKAFDNLGNPSTCTFLTNYLFDNQTPDTPIYTSMNPVSPTNKTVYPKVTGLSSVDTSLVQFYANPLCIGLIGTGTKASLETSGILINVLSNSITSVYANAIDAAGNASDCVFFTNYKHNVIPPDPPIFGDTNPVSPNNISANPYIFGSASFSTVSLEFFKDDLCSTNTFIGSGSADLFNTTGIQIFTPNIPNSVNTTLVYAQSIDEETNRSECTAMSTYAFSTAKAENPTFVSFSPTSPSRTNSQPTVFGTAPVSVTQVRLFDDNQCTNLMGTSSRVQFNIQGIVAALPTNKFSNIYAISLDKYGNSSDCVYFTNYIHDAVQPIAPVFLNSNPAPPTRLSVTPALQGAVTINKPGKILPVNQVRIFDNMLCLGSPVGSGTPTEFANTGIVSNAAANAVTNFYAQTADAAGNVSDCTFLLNYTHSNTAPGNPTFISSTPASPSYNATTAFVGTIGSSSNIMPAVNISFYSNNSCNQLIATTSVSAFKTTGSFLTLPINQSSDVYAQVVDSVGNLSQCRLMQNFVHNNIGPQNLQTTLNQDGSVNLNWIPDTSAYPTAKYVVKRSTRATGPYTILAWQQTGSSFTDYSVQNNQTYYYVVAGTNNTGTSRDSIEASIVVNTGLAAAANTLVATPGSQVVYLNWQGFSSDMYFKILRSTQTGGPYTELVNNLSLANYLDETVSNNTNYFYVVVATNPSGKTSYSNEAKVTPIEASSPPLNLKIQYVQNDPNCSNGNGVELSWSAPSYYTGFQVKRGGVSGATRNLGTVTNLTTAFDCNFVDLTGQYKSMYYRVEAKWGPAQKESSTAESNEVGINFNTGPTLTVSPGNQHIYAKWTTVLTADSYQVWRSTKSGWPNPNYVLLDGQYLGTNYLDTNVVNGTAYFYMIVPNFDKNRVGIYSNEQGGIPATNPTNPSGLIVSKDTTSDQPVLNWIPPAHFNGFNVYRSQNVGGPFTFISYVKKETFTDNLTQSGIYYYLVTSVWGSFESTASNTVTYSYGTPLTVTATSTATSIDLSWASVTNAVSYNILRSTSAGGPYSLIQNTSVTTFSNTTSSPVSYTLNSTNGYFYVVQPVFTGGLLGQYSTEVSSSLTVDNIPKGLTVVASTSSNLQISWAIVNSATQYTIYKSSTLGGIYTSVGTSNLNTFSVSPLLMGTTYYIKVAARVSGVLSSMSSAVSGLTVDKPYTPAVLPGNNSVDVSWLGVAGATSYNLLRSTDGTNFSTLQTNVSGGQFTDSTASNGQVYFYQIKAFYSNGSLLSLPSPAVVPGITPLVPTGISLNTNETGTDAIISWGPVSGATNYNVYLSTTSGGPWGSPVTTPSTSFANYLSGLSPDTKYYVAISAVNGSMESALSSEFAFVTGVTPAAPSVSVLQSDIVINWAPISGATQYDLWRSIDGISYSLYQANLATTSYTDLAPAIEYTYFYKYYPKDTSGAEMSISAASAGVVPGVIPLAPTSLKAEALNNASIQLGWIAAPQAVNYNVYRSLSSGGPYILQSTINSSVLSYQDVTVLLNNTYFYIIKTVNKDGIESLPSNEVSINLIDGPSNVYATVALNKITINYDLVATATQYLVYRSTDINGPFGLIATVNSPMTSYADSSILSGTTYYYYVQAQFSNNSVSINSNTVNAVAIRLVNLEVPVELTDQALASDTQNVLFERTRTTLDTAAYDGTVTYSFEAIASNMDNSPVSIKLVNGTNSVVATLIIPANNLEATRFKTSFIPALVEDDYRIQISATSQVNFASVYSSRILIKQIGATKTKIYYPLLTSSKAPNNLDFWSPTESTNSSSYSELPSARIFKRDLTKLSHLIEYTPWELEIIVASGGGKGVVSLFNASQQQIVEGTEIEFDSDGMNSVVMVNSPFNEGALNFKYPINQLNQYQLIMKCTENCLNGSINLYKAGLWVSLESIEAVEILYRNSSQQTMVISDTAIDTQRTWIDLSYYSNPIINFQATGSIQGMNSTIQLLSAGNSDGGFLGLVNVLGSDINLNSGIKQLQQTSTPININSLDRFVTGLVTNGSTLNFLDSALIIQVSP